MRRALKPKASARLEALGRLMEANQERIIGVILATAVFGLVGAGICGWGWYRAATTPTQAADLSPEERQVLVEDMLKVGAGVYEQAYFEPRIGYTLRRGQEIAAWGDTFLSNELGYRAGPPAKTPGTFRVVFVGDSWTMGMGVKQEQAFAKVFERLANQHSGLNRPVEGWALALPGYNTLNELAALWFFFETLEPDAVVICPTDNDHHSTQGTLPNGSPWRDGSLGDLFGDPHVVTYPFRLADTYRSRQRWRQAMAAIDQTTARLESLSVPVMLYFAAIWSDPWVHGLMQESGLEAPYVVCPAKYNLGEWGLPPPIGHGTPAAHEVYGRIVYQGLAEVLGWPMLPAAGDDSDVLLHRGPPPETDWVAQKDYLLRQATGELVPESFEPRPGTVYQCAGPMDTASGLMGRATTVLVRRRAGAQRLLLTARRLSRAPSLYPMTLEVRIPSSGGGTRAVVDLFPDDRERQEIFLPIPADTQPGRALDVVLVAERVAKSPRVLAGHSIYVESIEQLD